MTNLHHVNEVDLVLKRIEAQARVSKYIIFNENAIPIRSSGFGDSDTVKIAANMSRLVEKCSKGCQDLLDPPDNEVECLRLRTSQYEIIVAPGKSGYTLVAFQENEVHGTDAEDGVEANA